MKRADVINGIIGGLSSSGSYSDEFMNSVANEVYDNTSIPKGSKNGKMFLKGQIDALTDEAVQNAERYSRNVASLTEHGLSLAGDVNNPYRANFSPSEHILIDQINTANAEKKARMDAWMAENTTKVEDYNNKWELQKYYADASAGGYEAARKEESAIWQEYERIQENQERVKVEQAAQKQKDIEDYVNKKYDEFRAERKQLQMKEQGLDIPEDKINMELRDMERGIEARNIGNSNNTSLKDVEVEVTGADGKKIKRARRISEDGLTNQERAGINNAKRRYKKYRILSDDRSTNKPLEDAGIENYGNNPAHYGDRRQNVRNRQSENQAKKQAAEKELENSVEGRFQDAEKRIKEEYGYQPSEADIGYKYYHSPEGSDMLKKVYSQRDMADRYMKETGSKGVKDFTWRGMDDAMSLMETDISDGAINKIYNQAGQKGFHGLTAKKWVEEGRYEDFGTDWSKLTKEQKNRALNDASKKAEELRYALTDYDTGEINGKTLRRQAQRKTLGFDPESKKVGKSFDKAIDSLRGQGLDTKADAVSAYRSYMKQHYADATTSKIDTLPNFLKKQGLAAHDIDDPAINKLAKKIAKTGPNATDGIGKVAKHANLKKAGIIAGILTGAWVASEIWDE